MLAELAATAPAEGQLVDDTSIRCDLGALTYWFEYEMDSVSFKGLAKGIGTKFPAKPDADKALATLGTDPSC